MVGNLTKRSSEYKGGTQLIRAKAHFCGHCASKTSFIAQLSKLNRLNKWKKKFVNLVLKMHIFIVIVENLYVT